MRFAIVAFFTVFGLGLAGPLALYNYVRSTDSALDVASSLIQKSGDTVLLKTRLAIQPFNFLADHIQLMPEASAMPQGFKHPLLGMFLDILAASPQIYSLYFGYGDGSFYQLITLHHRPKLGPRLKAPPGTEFAVRSIALQGGKHMERWLFLGPDQKRLGELPSSPALYDPRVRPWFVSAAQMDGPQRTPLYVFSSTQELGLTVSRRMPGGTPVVFGMDMTLDSISDFLRGESLGKSGLLFMFDSTGGLIGYPDQARARESLMKSAQASTSASTSASTLTPALADLNDPVALGVFRAFEAAGKVPLEMTRLTVGGVEYLCQVRRVEEFGSTGDYMALVAKVDDYTEVVTSTRNTSLLFALGIMVVLVPLLGLAATRLSRGLCSLSHEADRIRRLELDSKQVLHSHIDEMDQLGCAVAGMRSALNSSVRFLPKALIKQFLETGVDPVLGGDRRVITLLFTDVENFTPLAENLIPEELMLAMSEYFEVVGKAILDSGGTIDKFIGDAVMAFWNAPFESADHVEKACLAALRLSKASEELNARRQEQELPLLRTRVGLHTGAAVVGNVGASDRMDYTALGSSVNLASRLEGLNKFYSTRILASRDVRERACASFLFRSVDVVVPKGTKTATAIFELVGSLPGSPWADVAIPRELLGFCSHWERAITLYRTMHWPKALEEFSALLAQRPEDKLAAMYCQRTRRLLENKQGKDWKAVQRFQLK